MTTLGLDGLGQFDQLAGPMQNVAASQIKRVVTMKEVDFFLRAANRQMQWIDVKCLGNDRIRCHRAQAEAHELGGGVYRFAGIPLPPCGVHRCPIQRGVLWRTNERSK